jgi:hypothetical protein
MEASPHSNVPTSESLPRRVETDVETNGGTNFILIPMILE